MTAHLPRLDGDGRRYKHGYDCYPTPAWVVELLLLQYLPTDLMYRGGVYRPSKILEPCCGSGNLCAALHKWAPNAQITGLEIDPRFIEEGETRSEAWGTLTQGDAVAWAATNSELYPLIITNPPYAYEMPVKLFWALWPHVNTGGKLALLLRLDWLGSRSRRAVFDEQMPDVVVVADRVKFDPCGDQAPFYVAWFVWTKGAGAGQVSRVMRESN